MARNIVICCDGTSNQFGTNNTNVVRLVQVAQRDPGSQHVYYDPGVGTLPEPGWITWAGKLVSTVAGLAFGAGLSWKIQEAYRYLMEVWEPGDRVFCFGFSRGAYAVRVLSGLLHELGLLARGGDNLIPYAMRLFKTARRDHHRNISCEQSEYWKLRDQFRRTFARPVMPGDDDRRFPVHFLGLWDTVSSVGWVWDPPKFPFITHNPGVSVARHAVSLDERRWFFRQNLLGTVEGQDLLQYWFPGSHCDVGGGYPATGGGLSLTAFEWMLKQAQTAGLLVNAARLNELLMDGQPWEEREHESLTPIWWPAEFFPKLCWNSRCRCRVPGVGLGRHRHVGSGQVLAQATLCRIREKNYSPPNLSSQFLKMVRSLETAPESLAYSP